MKQVILALWAAACLAVLATAGDRVTLGRQLDSPRGAVACVDEAAARIGAEVLADGGNAVDAAIAVGFALAVTHPSAGNLGGGGFLLAALADGRCFAFDYREMAPALAGPDMFLDEAGRIDPERAGIGHHVVGVPGTVAGLWEAHQRLGTLPWPRLVHPARELAQEGFRVDADLADRLRRHRELLARYPGTAACFLHADGRPYQEGELLVQGDLANSLRWIEEGGRDAFYRGPIARLLDAEMRQQGGLIRLEDLASYQVVVREPVRFRYRDHEVLGMPPPSSGGVALAHILGLLEGRDLGSGGPGTAPARHRLAEAQRRAFAARARWLGDPEATPIDLPGLLSAATIAELGAGMDGDRATPSASLGPPLTDGEAEHTTHFSVVDRHGNAVANTYTLEESYGSKVVAPGTGFLLNNELHDFNLKPGLTDRRGRIGTAPNLARPGARPLSSMSPTIVRKDGEVVLVTGSPGGRTIINTVAWILFQVLGFGVDLPDAVAAPRQHHQWFPDRLLVEDGVDEAVVEDLRRRGHQVQRRASIGDAHSIARDPSDGTVQAVADRRLDGWVAAPNGPAPDASGR